MSMKTEKKVAEELNKVPFKTRVRPYLIVAPSLIITIGIMIPFVMAIWYSLTNYSFKLPTHTFIGLRNWIEVLSSYDFWNALWISLLYGVSATVVEMALGMGVAILLNNLNNRLSRILRVLLVFPLMVAPVTATIVWQLMLNSSVGILEKFLNLFGVYNFPWAASPRRRIHSCDPTCRRLPLVLSATGRMPAIALPYGQNPSHARWDQIATDPFAGETLRYPAPYGHTARLCEPAVPGQSGHRNPQRGMPFLPLHGRTAFPSFCGLLRFHESALRHLNRTAPDESACAPPLRDFDKSPGFCPR